MRFLCHPGERIYRLKLFIINKSVEFFGKYAIVFVRNGKKGELGVYKQCRTEQSAQRQRQLEQGLLEAMAVRHYDEISVSDLCVQMQIPRKSFYRYFSSKEGALHALIDHSLLDFEGFVGPGEAGNDRTLVHDMERVFHYWKQNKVLLDTLAKSGLDGVLIKRAIAFSVSEVTLPRRFLPEEDRRTQEHITMFTVCGLMSLVVQWHSEGYPQTAQEMARLAVRLVSQPLFPDAAKFY